MYLVGANVTDVEMAVLPDATEDDISKLPIPVIATANNGGTSLIKENGTVIDFNDAIGAGRPAATTTIRGNDIVHWNVNNGTLQQFFNALSATADSNNDVKYNYTSGGGHNSCENVSALLRKAGDGPFYLATRSPKSIAAAAQSGLSIFVDGTTRSFSTNNPSIFDTRVAYITSDYNTGWMYGDIRLATLSETTTDPAGLPLNIVSNGTFDSNVDGWSLRGSGTEPTHSNGKLQLTGNSSWHVVKFTRNYNFIAGEEYFIIFTMGGTSSRGVVDYSGGVFYPTTGSNYYYPSAAGTYVVKYTPNSATPDLAFVFNNTSGDTGTLDNVSIAPAIKDRSLKAGCLAVFGTINRNKANSNGDLVSYSGFSSSSYIEQQFNASTMNHGTGDFCYCFWVNLTSAGNGNQTFIDRSSANNQTTSPRLRIHQMDAAGHVRLYTDGGSATGTKTSILNVGWTQIVALRRSGTLELYINGNLEKSASSSTDFSSTAGQVRVGLDGDGTDPLNNGSISLLRISASAPTAEQIKEMYNEESCFFYANGKATLYGSSDAVTAVAYDDTTSLLHVGTSDGRSVFSGLKRVENTTTAVTTAISASNGLVVEQ